MVLFSWWQRRRRGRLRALAFPAEWLEILRHNVHYYGALSAQEQAKLRGDLRILVAEKNWEGCGGLQMTEEIQVTIAAQASLLLLGFEDYYFERVQSILVYPDAFVAPERTVIEGGVVLEGHSEREGEAWYRGPVVLSWSDALAGGRRASDGDNLVLHEFAHQLDMQHDGEIDGMPPLETRAARQRWQQVMSREFERLRRDCEAGLPTLLDCYGTTDEAEFFAVATECFFERSRALRIRHRQLYEVLAEFYRQDPAARDLFR